MDIPQKGTPFVLRLPEPHSRIIITSPRLEDANEILPILNDERVYPWMGAGLPYPHKLEHAVCWLKAVTVACDLGQEDLQMREAINGHEETTYEGTTPHYVGQCPVRILREVVGYREVYLGDCGIKRWNFHDMTNEQQRNRCKRENDAKNAGDPTIIWMIGYYLNPNYHGKRIMKTAVSALMRWAGVNMNVRHIRTTAMEGNKPSVKLLEHNGFRVEKTLPNFALKAGIKVGLHVLEWKANL